MIMLMMMLLLLCYGYCCCCIEYGTNVEDDCSVVVGSGLDVSVKMTFMLLTLLFLFT